MLLIKSAFCAAIVLLVYDNWNNETSFYYHKILIKKFLQTNHRSLKSIQHFDRNNRKRPLTQFVPLYCGYNSISKPYFESMTRCFFHINTHISQHLYLDHNIYICIFVSINILIYIYICMYLCTIAYKIKYFKLSILSYLNAGSI